MGEAQRRKDNVLMEMVEMAARVAHNVRRELPDPPESAWEDLPDEFKVFLVDECLVAMDSMLTGKKPEGERDRVTRAVISGMMKQRG